MTQRAKHGGQVAVAMLYRAQAVEGGECRLARRFERGLYVRKFRWPVGQPRPHIL
jgi:hypothetical protein